MSERVAPGRRVEMRFSLELEDGTEVEGTAAGETFAFEMGDGSLDAGLESRLEGLAAGDKARFHLAPGEAFGDPDPAAVQPMDRSEFPADMELAPGTVVGFSTPAGDEVAGTVMELLGESVVMDFNHPLAGRVLVFRVEVVNVS